MWCASVFLLKWFYIEYKYIDFFDNPSAHKPEQQEASCEFEVSLGYIVEIMSLTNQTHSTSPGNNNDSLQKANQLRETNGLEM